MTKENSIKEYIANLIFPVLWLASMTSAEAVGVISPHNADYFFMLYFGGFFVYFVFVKRQLDIKAFLSDIKTFVFWKYALICVALLIAAFGIGSLPGVLFPGQNLFFIKTSFVRAYDMPSGIAFFFSAILFPALGQELFYRKAMIRFTTKRALVLSTMVGALLFAINDNLDLYGIFRSFLVGVAFAVPYIKTRNINPSIFAHYFVSVATVFIF
jgi:hypothetical protein